MLQHVPQGNMASIQGPAMENAPRDRLRQHQLDGLRTLLAQVLDSNPFYRQKLFEAGLRSAEEVRSPTDLRHLPFTTKRELVVDQAANPLFGSNLTYPL